MFGQRLHSCFGTLTPSSINFQLQNNEKSGFLFYRSHFVMKLDLFKIP